MKALCFLVVLLMAGLVGLGFYRGWFHASTAGTERQPGITVGMDEDKIQADKRKAEALGDKAKGNAADPTDKSKEQQPRP